MSAKNFIDCIDDAVGSIRAVIGDVAPKYAVICGSGMADLADGLQLVAEVNFSDISGFPDCSVQGHRGSLALVKFKDSYLIIMRGRLHLYEGLSPQVYMLYLGLLHGLGVNKLLITNAVGGIRADLSPGSMVLITDHINQTGMSPLVGLKSANGAQFVNMERCYDEDIGSGLQQAANRLGFELKTGTYLGTLGPNFETPAEVSAFKTLGADVVGMSTVLEVIAARYYGLRVGVLSVVTNYAAGISDEYISHDLTLARAQETCGQVVKLIYEYLGVDSA